MLQKLSVFDYVKVFFKSLAIFFIWLFAISIQAFFLTPENSEPNPLLSLFAILSSSIVMIWIFRKYTKNKREGVLISYGYSFIRACMYGLFIFFVAWGIAWGVMPEDTEIDTLGMCILVGFSSFTIIASLKSMESNEKKKLEDEKKRIAAEAKKRKQERRNREELEEKRRQEAANKLLKETQNLQDVKDKLAELEDELTAKKAKRLEKYKLEYEKIIAKVEKEQTDLNELSKRHPLISQFLETRNTDDLSLDVFNELRKRFKSI
jgi:flagellar biosynthesis GTPase FlhF